jgi:3-hydroxyisobutyrate dehydrogenase
LEKIAVFGLGDMGFPIANNLVKRGLHVIGMDLLPEKVGALVSCGGHTASSVAEAVRSADAVLTVLPSPAAVRKLYLDDGIVKHAKRGTLLIECSTIDFQLSRDISAAAAAAGLGMVDAPVSGGTARAAEGKLVFMVGGSREDFERAEKIVKNAASSVVHMGDHGSGIAMKLCNNMLLAVALVGVAETCVLAQEIGIDPRIFYEVLQKSSGQTFAMDVLCPIPGIVPTAPSSRGYKPGGKSALMLKDMRLVKEVAVSLNVPTPMADLAASLYTIFCASGGADMDVSAIIKMLTPRNEDSGIGVLRGSA